MCYFQHKWYIDMSKPRLKGSFAAGVKAETLCSLTAWVHACSQDIERLDFA